MNLTPQEIEEIAAQVAVILQRSEDYAKLHMEEVRKEVRAILAQERPTLSDWDQAHFAMG